MAGTHARFAPSSAHRVIECPASLLLNEREPDDASYEAVEGTVAHWAHEDWLLKGARPTSLLGKKPWSFMHQNELSQKEWQIVKHSYFDPRGEIKITEEMLDHLEESIIRCLELPGDRYVEQRVDISPWCPEPDQKGTADFFACSPGHLDIADLKYGVGVQVFAYRNYQAILYALGVINEYDWLYNFETITIRIHQPRLNHYDVWETTKEELLEIGEFIKVHFARALQPNPPFGASEKACQFCKIKHKCEHLTNTVLSHFEIEDGDDEEDVRVNAAFLSPERQVEIFKMRGLYDLWIGSIQGDIERRLKEDPKSIPGLKIVNGRSTRYWINEKAALDELLFNDIPEEKLYKPREFVSPAQAEKLGKKLRPIVSELVEKRLGKPVVVDANDPRPDYQDDNSASAHKHFEFED